MFGTGRAFRACSRIRLHSRELSLGGRRFSACALLTLPIVLSVVAAPSAHAAPIPLRDVARSALSESRVDAANPEMRVRLDRVKPAFTLSGMNLRFSGLNPKDFSAFRGIRIYWAYSNDGIHSWVVEDRDTGQTLAHVRARRLEIAGQSIRFNLRSVPDRLSLVPTGRSQGDLIAKLDLETYLRGVLPAEMPSGWPMEALKAQAVAARTFALHRRDLRERLGSSYHVESDVMDQMFLHPVDQPTANASKIEQALRQTRGEVLYSNSRSAQPLAAYFHADCGGHTEEAKTVWGQDDGAGVAKDTACPSNPKSKWSLQLNSAEIVQKLAGQIQKGPNLTLAAIDEINKTNSGRIKDLRLTWSDGATSVVSAHQFRMAIGSDRIKSTNFVIESDAKGVFEFSGRGFGHGVGLCQWGARHLAVKGKRYDEILRHYYPKAAFKTPSAL